MKRPLASLVGAARTFWQDTDGIILPYVTVMLVVIVGLSLLALDGTRYMSLQSQLQKGADALAIAAAAELDRMPDSTSRAMAAVDNLITNSSVFGTGGAATVTDSQVRFISSQQLLPADNVSSLDAYVMCSGNACTADQSVQARFVEVQVTPTSISTIFPIVTAGGAGFLPPATVTAGASATAGFDQVVCDFTPMFVCNPYADATMTYAQATKALQDAVASPALLRRQIQMRRGGGGEGQYSPGNYGFLDNPTLGSGADALRNAIAMVSPTACFRQTGVDTKPGFVASVRDAVNVRFDIYNGPLNGKKDDPNFRPAANKRKGYLPEVKGANVNYCNAAPVTDQNQAMGLPRDNCFASTCPNMGGRMGDGNWDFDKYWTVNHASRGNPTVDGATWSNTNLPSRYRVYRYEIDRKVDGLLDDPSPGSPPVPGEVGGAPFCATSTPSDDPDRRIFYAAIVNCQANLPPKLPIGPGNQSGIPVAAFAKFFITEPVPEAQDEIMAEIVELVTPGSLAGHNFDQVQLYR